MAETFNCDNCGNEFPVEKMKEVFREEGKERVKEQLCASCLDQRMNEAESVRGVAGEEKKAAVHINDGENGSPDGKTERESLGTRDE